MERVRTGILARCLAAAAFVASTWAVPPAALAQNSSSNSANTAPNAGDQQNNSADLRLAARIRRAVYKDKSLSTRAHNVTIVVRNGTVTLRGAVKTQGEKDSIHRKAAAMAGSSTINDMLTVETQ